MTQTPQDPRQTGETTDQTWPPGPGQEIPSDQTQTDPGTGYNSDLGPTGSDLGRSDVDYQSDPLAATPADTSYATENLEGTASGYVGTTVSSSSAEPTSTSTKDVAKEEAAQVKDTAATAGRQVAETTKDQAQQVASEVKAQSKELWQQTVSELGSQAGSQQRRLGELVSGYATELRSMADNSSESGLLTSLAGDAADRAEEISDWLSNREPREVLDSVRSFARRRPAAFLAIAAVSGFLVGRLTRGLAADAKASSDDGPRRELDAAPAVDYSTPSYGYVGTSAGTDYETSRAPVAAGYPTEPAMGTVPAGQPWVAGNDPLR